MKLPRSLVKLFLFLTLLAATVACASGAPPPPPQDRFAAQDEILEAVFRYQFQHNASALQSKADRYCLTLPQDKNPGEDFLHRFNGNQPPAVSADECNRKKGNDLFFRIQNLDWRSDQEVWVRGGYWEGNLSSSVELYQVVRKDGKWTVAGSRMEAIS
jgi:hypothetical protein